MSVYTALLPLIVSTGGLYRILSCVVVKGANLSYRPITSHGFAELSNLAGACFTPYSALGTFHVM